MVSQPIAPNDCNYNIVGRPQLHEGLYKEKPNIHNN